MPATVNMTMGPISGTVAIALGATHQPLKGVRVDVYRFTLGADGTPTFQQMNQLPALTDGNGAFSFTNLRALVTTQLVGSSIPPYTPVPRVLISSLPSLVFHVTVASSVLSGGATAGTSFVEVEDERPLIDAAWILANPSRIHVPLSGAAAIQVLIDGSNAVAGALAGIGANAVGNLPLEQVALLRVGRATRADISEIGSAAGKAGYMTSATGSFFPGVVDAPFGGALQIGGFFGADFLLLGSNLYYAMSFSTYTGSPTALFDPSLLSATTPILDPLVNQKYLLPTSADPSGSWQLLPLGPFAGNVTAVAPGADPGAVGTTVQVYQRPPVPNPLVEYYPFWDLLVSWSSAEAPNALVVLTIHVYERTGGTDESPQLTLRAIHLPAGSQNDHLPLLIDNRPPVPSFAPFHLGSAQLATPFAVTDSGPLGPCGNLPITPSGLPSGRNECLIAQYSIGDGSGAPHQHLALYGLSIRYTPRGTSGSTPLFLIPTFPAPYQPISGAYAPVSPPVLSVWNQRSVLVPPTLRGWPPDSDVPTPCPQYAAAISLGCSVRTVDGWGSLFGTTTISQFIIISH